MNDPATTPSALTTHTLFDVLCRVLGLWFCVHAAISLVSNLVHGFFLTLLTDSLVAAAAGLFLILRVDLVQRWCWRRLPVKPAA